MIEIRKLGWGIEELELQFSNSPLFHFSNSPILQIRKGKQIGKLENWRILKFPNPILQFSYFSISAPPTPVNSGGHVWPISPPIFKGVGGYRRVHKREMFIGGL